MIKTGCDVQPASAACRCKRRALVRNWQVTLAQLPTLHLTSPTAVYEFLIYRSACSLQFYYESANGAVTYVVNFVVFCGQLYAL